MVFWISKYEVYSFKIKWKFSAFWHLMQSKQSKFKANENFPGFELKTWNLWIFPFLLNLKVTFFLFQVIFLVFRFWVSFTTKNWSKRLFFKISKFSISSIGQNQRLRNLGNFIFLVIITFKVFSPLFFYVEFLLVKYITRNVKNPSKHRELRNFNSYSLMGYFCKMETNLLTLILIRKESLGKI